MGRCWSTVAFQEVTGASQASPLVDKQLRLVLDTVEHEWAAMVKHCARDPFPVEALWVWVRRHDRQWMWQPGTRWW